VSDDPRFRLAVLALRGIVFGEFGVRDPDNRCDGFEPGTPLELHPAGTACSGDGHYLCKECIHHDADPEDQ
jgi:hypothetical protein